MERGTSSGRALRPMSISCCIHAPQSLARSQLRGHQLTASIQPYSCSGVQAAIRTWQIYSCERCLLPLPPPPQPRPYVIFLTVLVSLYPTHIQKRKGDRTIRYVRLHLERRLALFLGSTLHTTLPGLCSGIWVWLSWKLPVKQWMDENKACALGQIRSSLNIVFK